jgi:hypothetical protein
MKWQMQDWRYVKRNFPRGTWCCVQDFSENYTIEVALENQSKYYNNISITLFGIIGYFWIDDLCDAFANQGKREDMKKACAAKGTPPILTCALVFISDDLRHNQAFVQFANDIAYDYVAKNIMERPPFTTYARSDGAPTQFCNATQFFWIGMQASRGRGRMDWCLHCSCHGKDACDSELGGLKNILRRHLLTENIDSAASVRINNFKDIKTTLLTLGADFPNQGEFVPGGVYRRVFFDVPAIGPGSAPQNIPRGKSTKGATACRQFTDVNSKVERANGTDCVSERMRPRSCHFCECCMRLDPTNRAMGGADPCRYADLCGDPDNIVVVQRDVVAGTKLVSSDIGKKRREEEAALAGNLHVRYV